MHFKRHKDWPYWTQTKAKQKSKTGKRQTKNILNNKKPLLSLQPTPGFNTTWKYESAKAATEWSTCSASGRTNFQLARTILYATKSTSRDTRIEDCKLWEDSRKIYRNPKQGRKKQEAKTNNKQQQKQKNKSKNLTEDFTIWRQQ